MGWLVNDECARQLTVLLSACVCVSTHARGYGIPYGMGVTGDTSKMLKMSPNRLQI